MTAGRAPSGVSRGSTSGAHASRPSSHPSSNAFRASSTPSGHPKTFNYRRDNLTSASIYIHVLQERQLPFEIRAFVHAISHDIETDALAAAHAPTLPWRDSVVALAGQVAQYTLEHESTWMEFNRRVFSILENELLKRCQDIQFNVQVGPTAHRRHTLATPTPDLAFGLPTTREDESRGGLARDFLLCIPERFGIRPFPSTSPNTPDLVFPCIIFEAKSELGSICEAQNQAAHGAAKALAMVRTLLDRHRQPLTAQASLPRSLPVVVMCSQGGWLDVYSKQEGQICLSHSVYRPCPCI